MRKIISKSSFNAKHPLSSVKPSPRTGLRAAAAAVIMAAVLLTGCAGGENRPSIIKKTTNEIKQAPIVENKSSASDLTNQYYKTIALYFSGKSYDKDRKYNAPDAILPNEAENAVTNLGMNWLVFLRNEILARHGLAMIDDYLKDTLGKTAWFKADPNFNLAKSLNEKESRNIDYIRKLEKIDADGPKDARQLAVILKLQKEALTADEAIKVWKATGKKDVLTKVSKWDNKLETIQKDVGNLSIEKISALIALNAGERIFIGKLPNGLDYIIESVIKTTNFYFENGEGDQYFFPYSFDVDENGNIWIPLKGGISEFDNNGNLIKNYHTNSRYSGYFYIHFNKEKNGIITGNNTESEIIYLDSTNYHYYNYDESLMYYTNIVIDSQKDIYDNIYSRDLFGEKIVINDIPSIMDISPPIPDHQIVRSFIVKKSGDIYFRWALTISNQHWFYLFKAKVIGKGN